MIPSIGPLEIGILLIIALIVFGPKRLPELGSSMGKGIRGFSRSLKGEEDEHPARKPIAEATPTSTDLEAQRSGGTETGVDFS